MKIKHPGKQSQEDQDRFDSDVEGDDFFEDKPQLKTKPKPVIKIAPNQYHKSGPPKSLLIKPIPNTKAILPKPKPSDPFLPKTTNPREPTSACPVCQKTMISKYLKYHIEATHYGATVPGAPAPPAAKVKPSTRLLPWHPSYTLVNGCTII